MKRTWHTLTCVLPVALLCGCSDEHPEHSYTPEAGGPLLGGSPSLDASLPRVDAASCRRQCTEAVNCVEQPLASFPNYASTLAEWKARCPADRVAGHYVVRSGLCAEGTPFLSAGGVLGVELRFFDDAGLFVSQELLNDDLDETCRGALYWPAPAACTRDGGTTLECGALLF